MKKIFFVNYLMYRPNLPNISCKYEMLSDFFTGDMVAICPKESDNTMLGRFHFHAIRKTSSRIVKYLVFVYSVLKYGMRSNRKQKIDFIIAYDPLLCGISSYLLKNLIRSKLIVEVNGDVVNAGFLGEIGLLQKIKRRLVMATSRFILNRADRIKYLTGEMERAYSSITKNRNHEVFIDFVPTQLFMDAGNRFDRYVLFVGYPFYLKGVDILIKAFNMISERHEDFSLRIIGHCPDPAPYMELAGNNERISIRKAVYYDDIIDEFKNCYCFVLPSRSEGMGRVLIESMASGKPAIGSNVGGIPSLIIDGENGFLFEKESTQDLAEKLDIMLGNEALVRKMGENARVFVEKNLSSEIYISRFRDMIDSMG